MRVCVGAGLGVVAGQRGRLRPSRFAGLPAVRAERMVRLSLILRFAVLLNRSRTGLNVPTLRFRARKKALKLGFPPAWLDENPLTRTDLENEVIRLKKVGYTLTVE